MHRRDWRKGHLLLGLLALACILIDAGLLLTIGAALKWLAAATSPIVLAGLATSIILTVRIGRSLRWARPAVA